MVTAATACAQNHGFETSPYGKELVRIADRFDTKLHVDREKGFINSVAAEKDAWRYQGLKDCFKDCRTESDWRRPTGGAANWKPKTNWRACDRVDPSHLTDDRLQIPELEKEKQEEREREASFLKAEGKIQALNSQADPRDTN